MAALHSRLSGARGGGEAATEQQLGVVVERFATDNRRRRKIFWIAVPVGAVAGVTGLLMFVPLLLLDPGTPGVEMIPPSLIAGFGLGAGLVGAIQGRQSFARPDEAFTLHEGGLVHSYAGKSWAISWDEITWVREQGQDNAFHRALGFGVAYYVRFASPVGGRKGTTITSLTRDASRLGETVRHAAEQGTLPDGTMSPDR